MSLNGGWATLATTTPLRSTSYELTPTLSVEAVQFNVAVVAVTLLAANPVGTVGAWVSPLESRDPVDLQLPQ